MCLREPGFQHDGWKRTTNEPQRAHKLVHYEGRALQWTSLFRRENCLLRLTLWIDGTLRRFALKTVCLNERCSCALKMVCFNERRCFTMKIMCFIYPTSQFVHKLYTSLNAAAVHWKWCAGEINVTASHSKLCFSVMFRSCVENAINIEYLFGSVNGVCMKAGLQCKWCFYKGCISWHMSRIYFTTYVTCQRNISWHTSSVILFICKLSLRVEIQPNNIYNTLMNSTGYTLEYQYHSWPADK